MGGNLTTEEAVTRLKLSGEAEVARLRWVQMADENDGAEQIVQLEKWVLLMGLGSIAIGMLCMFSPAESPGAAIVGIVLMSLGFAVWITGSRIVQRRFRSLMHSPKEIRDVAEQLAGSMEMFSDTSWIIKGETRDCDQLMLEAWFCGKSERPQAKVTFNARTRELRLWQRGHDQFIQLKGFHLRELASIYNDQATHANRVLTAAKNTRDGAIRRSNAISDYSAHLE